MNSLSKLLAKRDCVQNLIQDVENANIKNILAYEIATGEYPYILHILRENFDNDIIIVSTTDAKAQSIHKALFSSEKNAIYLPSRDKQFFRVAQSNEMIWDRISSLVNVSEKKSNIVSTSIEAFLDIQSPKKQLLKSIINIDKSFVHDPNLMIDKLIKLGYERVSMVEGKGQCSLRGDILDVYSPIHDFPLRIEFFDNEVDTLRIFDPVTQRSIEQVNNYKIVAATECLIYDKDREYIIEKIRTAINESLAYKNTLINKKEILKEENLEKTIARFEKQINSLTEGYPLSNYQTYMHFLFNEKCTIQNYFENPIIIFIDIANIKDTYEKIKNDYNKRLNEAISEGLALDIQKNLYNDFEIITSSTNKKILFSDIKTSTANIKPDSIIKFGSINISDYQGNIENLISDIKRYIDTDMYILIYSGSQSRQDRLISEFLNHNIIVSPENDIIKGKVYIFNDKLDDGFIDNENNIVALSDKNIFGISYKKAKKRYENAEKIASYTELNIGDYVVHENYGIGIYKGIINIKRENVIKDYMLINYAGEDKLYVPTDQFDLIQKLAVSEAKPPSLNRLGNTEWQRKKSRIRKGLKELAFNLLKLYASRQMNNGFAFSKDNPWQMQFDDFFPYELTLDQEKCLSEIYMDMESHRTMDRLLCGDVGYGKTELALRAAFKAVCDSKQVAILAPTTILAFQHYNNVIKRFSTFPVNVAMISRFKTAKDQKKILEDLRDGKIDIIVGTHKLLSKDVIFKDIGLLVVDEEQRFGVGHKEIIKNLKNTVDVLTLSATPIPRTLYMSMIGVRDISIIQTPPEDRLPVKTYVVEYNDAIIKDAILREMSRGGQVYYLYNKVENIENMHRKLSDLIPDCKIAIAHGQMSERQLENTMMEFYNGNYDVLLCSTIIENGIDIPEANTLIVHDADKFGLSQLYQLRGRVGRSTRQAYAYLTIKPNYAISEIAQKRLQAIREFTEFGAGYRIAMRDLELRGAGNIFGPEQSGYICDIGFDTYLKLINEAVDEIRGTVKPIKSADSRVDLPLDSYLPSNYVSSEKERIEIYKRIAMINDADSRMDIEEELIDRYGDMPEEVENLTTIAMLRAYTRKIGISLINIKQGFLTFYIDEHAIEDPLLFINALSSFENKFVFSAKKPYSLKYISSQQNIKVIIKEIIPVLDKIIKYIEDNTNNEKE